MELSQPITIYWDLPEQKDPGALKARLADLLACRPLMLKLADPAPRLDEATLALLGEASKAPVSVSLAIAPAALDSEALRLLQGAAPKEILLDVSGLAPLKRWFGANREGLFPESAFGVFFRVTGGNWREIPELVTWCRREGISVLVFPMQRLYGGEVPFLIDPAEQRQLADALAAAGGCAGIALTIHDPFLWRAFHPGIPFPQGGCQAANTMLALAPDGSVYPCPSLPISLGTLERSSLKEIVRSPEKKELRRLLLKGPAGCGECGELAVCRGGCRGRGYLAEGSLDGADPACR